MSTSSLHSFFSKSKKVRLRAGRRARGKREAPREGPRLAGLFEVPKESEREITSVMLCKKPAGGVLESELKCYHLGGSFVYCYIMRNTTWLNSGSARRKATRTPSVKLTTCFHIDNQVQQKIELLDGDALQVLFSSPSPPQPFEIKKLLSA